MSQLVVLPEEVSSVTNLLKEEKRKEIENFVSGLMIKAEEWEKQVLSIEVTSIDDKMSMGLAKVAAKTVKDARIDIEKQIDAKRSEVQFLKIDLDSEDKSWLRVKQLMQATFKPIEEKAKWKADFVKRFEEEQKELKIQQRMIEVAKYSEVNRIEYEAMSDETFDMYLKALKSSYEEKIKEEQEAETERLRVEYIQKLHAERKEKALPYYQFFSDFEKSLNFGEQSESDFQNFMQRLEKSKKDHDAKQEEIRKENERLRLEAEEKEKALEIERKKAKEEADRLEAKRLAEIEEGNKRRQAEAEKLRIENEAKLKKEKEEKERLLAELKAKQEAEEKAEKARLEAEDKARKEAEKLAKAPVKKQLTNWVDLFEIPVLNVDHEKKTEIISKFEAFKKWAKLEIEKI
jgi:hypothetical protein